MQHKATAPFRVKVTDLCGKLRWEAGRIESVDGADAALARQQAARVCQSESI